MISLIQFPLTQGAFPPFFPYHLLSLQGSAPMFCLPGLMSQVWGPYIQFVFIIYTDSSLCLSPLLDYNFPMARTVP